MDYPIIPMGSATGNFWQYRLERESGFTPWTEWSVDIRLTEDPYGGALRINTQYWLYGRNPNIAPFEAGSLERVLACPCYLTESGRVVTGLVAAPDTTLAPATTYSVVPASSATGPGWQYQLVRGDAASQWVNWSAGLDLSTDPEGGSLRTGVLYWVYARNASIAPYEPGSVESPFVTGMEITPSGKALAASEDTQTPERVPTLDEVAKAGDLRVRGFTDQLLRLMGGLILGNIPATTEDLPHLVIDTAGKVWKKTTEEVISYTFRGFAHFEFVRDAVSETPRIARIDANTCDRITGWIYGGAARIERNSVVVAYIEPEIEREQAVLDLLATQGIVTTDTKRGFAYYKTNETGESTWEVYVGNSMVKATSDTGTPATLTCSGGTGTEGNPPPVVASAIPDWVITAYGNQTKSITGTFTDNAGDVGTYSSLYFSPAFNAFTGIPAWLTQNTQSGQYAGNFDSSIPNGEYLIKCFYKDSNNSTAAAQFRVIVNVATQEVIDCENYTLLTQSQVNPLPSVMVYEYYDPTVSMGGGLSYTVRAFGSRQEAIGAMFTFGLGSSKAQFDFNRATSSACNVGDTLYNDNRLSHILAGTNHLWPVEAGFWGINRVAPSGGNAGSFVLLETNGCGQIINRETIPIPLD